MGVKKTRERRDKACMDTLECFCSPTLTAAVTFNRADNCTDSSCHTFWEKKKGQVVPASFISNWTGSSTLDGPESTSKNKTHRSDNWYKQSVCVHGRVAAFLKITTHQMD